MTPMEFRVWVGWRATSLHGQVGWGRFIEALSKTFIPATWMVMPRYGLRAYLPSVTQADPPQGCPEETALLIYDTRANYERHKATVGGRGYGQMHGALFSFDAPGLSRSGWASPAGADPDQKSRLPSWFWNGTDPTLGLDSPEASVVFFMVGHAAAPVSKETAAALYRSLEYTDGQVVLCPTAGFTLAWVAVANPVAPAHAFATRLAAVLPEAQVHSQHVTRDAHAEGDYLEGPDVQVAVSDQMSLRFLKARAASPEDA